MNKEHKITRRQELAFLEYALDYFNGNIDNLWDQLELSHPEADEDTIIELIEQNYHNMPWESLKISVVGWKCLFIELDYYLQVNQLTPKVFNYSVGIDDDEITKELAYIIQLYKSKNKDRLDEFRGPIKEWGDNTVNYQTARAKPPQV